MTENWKERRIFWLALCLIFILPSAAFAATGSITGRVTDGDSGIADAGVFVYSSESSQVLGVFTDANGYYTAGGIPSGNYKVYFLGAFTGYINQWFSNKDNFTSADAVMVNAPGQTSGINAVLSAGGAVVGTVTDGTTPLPNIGIWVYNDSCSPIETGSTNYNGEYALGGLPSGNYRIFFDGGSTGYIGKWYNDKASCASSDSIAVSAPNTTSSIDAILTLTGGLAGRVTDGTNGIDHIVVGVYDSSCGSVLKTTNTNINGDYAIGGLQSGNYRILFFGGAAGFMSEWYSNQTSCALADFVTITDSTMTQNIDAVLSSLYRLLTVSLTGTGSGTVTSSPTAIDCGNSCSTSLILGTQVNLYANAASGSFFNSWAGACLGNASPCAITISDNNAVTASFNTYADFTASQTTGKAPLLVSFTDKSSNDPTAWSWAFGDSGASNLQNPAHTYVSAGTYSVTLSNTGPSGPSSLTKNSYVTVSPCENYPVLIGGLTNTSIQDAYDIQAVSGDVIEIQALDFPGALLFDKEKTVTLKGGFDCLFSTNEGQHTTVGTMTVGGSVSGTVGVIIENILIR